MAEEYTFVSEITKAVLPFGITKSTQVTREEAKIYLAKMLELAPKKFSEWGDMFVKSRTQLWTCWGAETLQKLINELGSDIDCLVSLTYCNTTRNTRKGVGMTEMTITYDFNPPEKFSLTNETRWLVKENHEKILQRLWFGDRGSVSWEDVPTVYEKGLEK